jgi:hypothetical protein
VRPQEVDLVAIKVDEEVPLEGRFDLQGDPRAAFDLLSGCPGPMETGAREAVDVEVLEESLPAQNLRVRRGVLPQDLELDL